MYDYQTNRLYDPWYVKEANELLDSIVITNPLCKPSNFRANQPLIGMNLDMACALKDFVDVLQGSIERT